MIRGSQTISQIFPSAIKTESSRKGNKGIYTQERDTCMCYRYFYYHQIHKIRLDDAVVKMEKDFFIGASTIMSRLVECSNILKDIVDQNPTLNELRKQYPQFNWN